MRALLFVLCLLSLATASAQYTAQIRQEHWAFQAGPGNEWEGEMFADLYENDVLVPPNPSLSYIWYRAWPNEPFEEFWYEYHILREGINTGSYRDFYVEIYQDNQLLATSPQMRITAPSNRKEVIMYLVREDGTTDGNARVHFWSTPQNWHPLKVAGNAGRLPLRQDYPEVLNARPDIFSAPEARYHRWTRVDETLPQFRNHEEFEIRVTTDAITAHYRDFRTDALINNYLIENSSPTGGFVEYRDPWLRDTTDSQFLDGLKGYRNLGMGAPFKSDPQPIQPNTTNKYKGVFTGQTVLSGIYYSVRAPLSKEANGFTWYFQDWQTSGGVSLQQVGSNPAGYDQKAAIFTGANAVITARYKAHPASSIPTATFSNSQRKFAADVGTLETKVALSYSSAGEIWLTESNTLGSGCDFPSVVAAGRSEHARRAQLHRAGRDFT